MKVVKSFKEIPSIEKSIAFSIGCFDGMHLGHQKLLSTMREKVDDDGICCVLTFSNHPIEHFQPEKEVLCLANLDLKLYLLKKHKIDLVILLDFNESLANQEYDQFLNEIRKHLPFDFFLIGEKDSFGKGKKGTFETVKQYGKKHHFETTEVTKVLFENKPISSGRIRSLIRCGDLKKAKQLLSRPFGILVKKNQWIPLKNKTSFEVLLDESLCLPPNGSYHGMLDQNGKQLNVIIDLQGKKMQLMFNKKIPPLEDGIVWFIQELL